MSLNHVIQSSPTEWLPLGCTSLVVSGSAAIQTQPYYENKLPSPLTVPTGTNTPLSGLTTVVRTQGTGISYSSSQGIYTVANTGVYTVSYTVTWNTGSSATTNFAASIVTGSNTYGVTAFQSNIVAPNSNSCSATIYLPAGTTFQMIVAQSSGGNLTITASDVTIYKNS